MAVALVKTEAMARALVKTRAVAQVWVVEVRVGPVMVLAEAVVDCNPSVYQIYYESIHHLRLSKPH